ncbi:hypothetical protein TYRP_004001 [Tyrophagus putrescentiae]|nr:hypothetical protein TYRP_004001 [Tyrophagus putrescentiae]
MRKETEEEEVLSSINKRAKVLSNDDDVCRCGRLTRDSSSSDDGMRWSRYWRQEENEKLNSKLE